MVSNCVSLRQLAEELSIDRSNLRKYVLRHNIPFERIRTKAGRHQLELALTNENAEKIEKIREKSGYLKIGRR